MNILVQAVASVPAGRWAVGVSGGADSVALLLLLCDRPELSLHVVHLDHQTRGGMSTEDAAFVRELSESRGLRCTIPLLESVEAGIVNLPANPSARYRAARMALFRQVVADQHLSGVILAHHADDQAETVLHRLIRGAGPMGLAGMSPDAQIGGLRILRPLLDVRREQLRRKLQEVGQTWREDASNESDKYLRNRLRRWLTADPRLHEPLMRLAAASRGIREWAARSAPRLLESFATAAIEGLPTVLAHEAARRWLIARGAPPDELPAPVLDRLIEMARDAASPSARHFPGALLVRRRQGMITAMARDEVRQ
jgi:tRNA(Ile)-lysidine synthase